MTEYVRMYAWLMRRVFKTKDFYTGYARSKWPENSRSLAEFEFWLTFYQLLAMETQS